MHRIASSALASALILLGISPVQADDWNIDSGSTFYRDGTSSDDLYTFEDNGDNDKYTTKVDIDCKDVFYSSTSGMKLAGGACINRIIDNVNKLGKGVQATAAMNTAMSTLPTASEAKTTCGVGTGGNSGTFALGVGCATNINDRLSVTTGGSIAFDESQDYGDDTIENYGLKAGFLYKFGTLTKSTNISMKEKKDLQSKVEDLAKVNKNIKNENQELKELLAIQNQRLEKLEQIALGNFNSKELVSSLQ